MNLQAKVLMVISGIWIIICLAVYVESKVTLESNYQTLEKKLVEQDVSRVQNVITNNFNTLSLYTRSFSQWDDAYQFMRDKNNRFIQINFVPGTFTSSNINFMMYFDQAGTLFYGRAFDLVNNKFMPISDSLLNDLSKQSSFVIHRTTKSMRSGFITTPDGYIAMSSLPVLTSDGSGPLNGSMLIGYYLTKNYFDQIASTVKMNVQFISLDEINAANDPVAISAFRQLKKGAEFYITNKDNSVADGFALLKDIDQHPIGLLKVSVPRVFYKESMTMINRHLATTLLLGVVVATLLWFLLKYIVLNRILSVSNQVYTIFSENKFNRRIHIKGNDEIQGMVTSINSMLELIALSQEQLKYRISLRTNELEKLSSLNKNIFKEMSEQRSAETKLREDEKNLKRLAYYDAVTELPNRTFFNELLKQAITNAEQGKNKIAILFVDVDKFKKINDMYGHHFGDNLLKVIAGQLRQSINSTDIVAHLAGDGFLLFLTNMVDIQMIDVMIKKLTADLEPPFNIDMVPINCTFSVGVSIYPDDSLNIEELYKQADFAMYHAKKKDGTVFCYFNEIKSPPSLPPSKLQ